MTFYGLSGKEGRNWLRHRLRHWRGRKLTPGEQFEEKNRSQAGDNKKIDPEASKISEALETMGLEFSETTGEIPWQVYREGDDAS